MNNKNEKKPAGMHLSDALSKITEVKNNETEICKYISSINKMLKYHGIHCYVKRLFENSTYYCTVNIFSLRNPSLTMMELFRFGYGADRKFMLMSTYLGEDSLLATFGIQGLIDEVRTEINSIWDTLDSLFNNDLICNLICDMCNAVADMNPFILISNSGTLQVISDVVNDDMMEDLLHGKSVNIKSKLFHEADMGNKKNSGFSIELNGKSQMYIEPYIKTGKILFLSDR